MGEERHEGSEDPREAREHVREARENREALEDQARRVERTTPSDRRRDDRRGDD
jgi:hypothetical protein